MTVDTERPTPRSAVLNWWRALQNKDVAAIEGLDSHRRRPGKSRGDAPSQGRVSALFNKPYPLDNAFLKQ
jgi:hypothetical protein